MAFTLAKRYTENALLGVLALAPMFALTVKGWTSTTLFLAVILSITLLLLDKNNPEISARDSKEKTWWVPIIITALAAPITAVFISQALRQDWAWKYYDAPSRFLIAIPLFLYIYKKKINVINLWQYSIPISLIITWLVMPYLPQTNWTVIPGRSGTYFADGLSFGHICITFAFLSFCSIRLNKHEPWLLTLLKLVGGAVGIYLSIQSGSRTGWMAIPLVLPLLLFVNIKKNKWVSLLIAFTITIAVLSVTYQTSTKVHDRVNLMSTEILSYHTQQNNNTTSVGMRISFARMGYYFFKLKPLSGWGDKGFKDHIDDAEIAQFADKFTREYALGALFHNEFTTNAVLWGIGGLVATLLLFFAPITLLVKNLQKSAGEKIALYGLTYMTFEIVSAMSTEVWNFKFTAALSAMMIVGLCGSALSSLDD